MRIVNSPPAAMQIMLGENRHLLLPSVNHIRMLTVCRAVGVLPVDNKTAMVSKRQHTAHSGGYASNMLPLLQPARIMMMKMHHKQREILNPQCQGGQHEL